MGVAEDLPEYIIKHRIDADGETLYNVKWVGFYSDYNTWETEEKLRLDWPDALLKYQQQVINQETLLDENKRDYDSVTTNNVLAYAKSVTDWEEQVEEITYVERTKLKGLSVYVKWKNGMKSVHHSTEVYAKCPQKMLDFFEKYLLFQETPKQQ